MRNLIKVVLNSIKQNPFAMDEGGGEDPSEAGPPAGADQCFCKLEGKVRYLGNVFCPNVFQKLI